MCEGDQYKFISIFITYIEFSYEPYEKHIGNRILPKTHENRHLAKYCALNSFF